MQGSGLYSSWNIDALSSSYCRNSIRNKQSNVKCLNKSIYIYLLITSVYIVVICFDIQYIIPEHDVWCPALSGKQQHMQALNKMQNHFTRSSPYFLIFFTMYLKAIELAPPLLELGTQSFLL